MDNYSDYSDYYAKYSAILMALAHESDAMVSEGFYTFWLSGIERFAQTIMSCYTTPDNAAAAWRRHVERRRLHVLSGRDRLSTPMFLWDGSKWELRR